MITTAQITTSITKIVIIVIAVLVAFWILYKLQKKSSQSTNLQWPTTDQYGMPQVVYQGPEAAQNWQPLGRN